MSTSYGIITLVWVQALVMTTLRLVLVVTTTKIYTVTLIHYLDYGNLSGQNVEHRLLQLRYFCVVGISFHT